MPTPRFCCWDRGWRGTLRPTAISTPRAVLRASAAPRDMLLLLLWLFQLQLTRSRGAWGGPSESTAPVTAECRPKAPAVGDVDEEEPCGNTSSSTPRVVLCAS